MQYSCMTVSIWLFNEFSSRNFLRRERNDVLVKMLTLPFFFDNKCPLPWICDEFYRQDTHCNKGFSLFHPFFSMYFVCTHCPVLLLSSLVALLQRMNGQFSFFFFSKMLKKCEVCCCGKLVETPNVFIDLTKSVIHNIC